MRVDVISIFPGYLAPLDLSLIGKARRDGLIDLRTHDLRDFTHDRHRTVDDTPYGGGAGMVMTPQPWAEALDHVLSSGPAERRPHLIVPGPSGTPFSQVTAGRLAAEDWLVFACGRYEGIDERVYDHAAQDLDLEVSVVSLGDYVLNGGEVAVLAIVEAVARLLPGVIGNAESLVEESHEGGLLEYPVYTKPARWMVGDTVREVPEVLLSGDHVRIETWRHDQRLRRTAERRPDLLAPASAVTSSTVAGSGDLDLSIATAADAPELWVLQLACWVPEAREMAESGASWTLPAHEEGLEDVTASLTQWTTWVARVAGRLVGAVRARADRDDATVWEIGRLMVAPDLQGRGLGRALLSHAESAAPPEVASFRLTTGLLRTENQRMYRKAGYRRLPGAGREPGSVDLVKPRR